MTDPIRLKKIATNLLERPIVNGKEMDALRYQSLLSYIISFTEAFMSNNGRRERPLTDQEMIMALSASMKWALEEMTK